MTDVVKNESAGIQLEPSAACIVFSFRFLENMIYMVTSTENSDVVDLKQECAPRLVDQGVLDDTSAAK